jgi:low affinity Fe/Cu permease
MPNFSSAFTQVASGVSRWTGRPMTFLACCLIVIVWGASGPVFGFSDTWQLVINTGTTIITFLMVFLIQNTQNRDNAALQAKLDELIRAHSPAKNEFIGIEHLSDEELEEILAECERNRPHVIDRAEKRVAGERKKTAADARRSATRRPAKARARKSA